MLGEYSKLKKSDYLDAGGLWHLSSAWPHSVCQMCYASGSGLIRPVVVKGASICLVSKQHAPLCKYFCRSRFAPGYVKPIPK